MVEMEDEEDEVRAALGPIRHFITFLFLTPAFKVQQFAVDKRHRGRV